MRISIVTLLCLGQVFAAPLFWGGGTVRPSTTISPTHTPNPVPVSIPTPAIPADADPPVKIKPDTPPTFTGRMTYYGVDGEPGPNEAYGACGFEPKTVNENFVAINGAQYTANECGNCIEVKYQGRCAEAVRVDLCPGCPFGGIDVSLGIFATLVGSEAEARRRGFVPDVEWQWIACGAGCM